MKTIIGKLLIVGMLLLLGMLCVRNLFCAVQMQRSLNLATEMTAHQEAFMGQQIQLFEAALASEPDAKTMEVATQRFLDMQRRYGTLVIDDPDAVAIVAIPEISLEEHLSYAWRIYVPPGQHVELTAYNGDKTPQPTEVDAFKFVQLLATGESVIRLVAENPYYGKWGNTTPPSKQTKPRASQLTISIDDHEFRWQREGSNGLNFFVESLSPGQQTLFESEETAELLLAASLHLVVRRSANTPGSEL